MNAPRAVGSLALSLLLTSLSAGCSDDTGEAGPSAGSGGQPAAGGQAGGNAGGGGKSAGGAGGSTGGAPSGGQAGAGGKAGSAQGGAGTASGGKAGMSSAGSSGASGTPSGGQAGAGGASAGSAGAVAGGASGESGAAGQGGRTYSTDPTTFFGEPRCGKAGVKLCDDFEAQAVGEAPDKATWEVQTWGKGTATIDDKHAARGKHSVHISAPAEVSRIVLRETKTFPATGNTFYGRFFLWLDYVPPKLDCANGCVNLVHWTAASASGPYTPAGSDKTYTPEVRAVGAVNERLLVNLDGGPEPEVGISDHDAPGGQDAPVAGKWMCFEFAYEGVGDQAEVRVWWDGLEHPGLHYSPSNPGETGKVWPIPTYQNLDFGFTHYQDYSAHVPGFDAWIDEIAVDAQRIGCDL